MNIKLALAILNLTDQQKDILTDVIRDLQPLKEKILKSWMASYKRWNPQTQESVISDLEMMGYTILSMPLQTGGVGACFERVSSIAGHLYRKKVPFSNLTYALHLLEEEMQASLRKIFTDKDDLFEATVILGHFYHGCFAMGALPYLKVEYAEQLPPVRSEQHLTDRETEVLRLIVDGYKNREIAKTLKVSIKTVEHHRANIVRKLGVSNVVQLVRYAIQEGLTT